MPPITSLPIRVSFIPLGNANRPGFAMTPTHITVHETANTDLGANAEMHRQFTHNGGGTEEVSFHWVVDEHEAIQLLPHNENGWHAGDGFFGPGNRQTVAIETCVDQGSDFPTTRHNLAFVIAKLCREIGISPDNVVQHNRWSGKDCPHRMRQSGWASLIAEVRDHLDQSRGGPPRPPEVTDPNARYFPETDKWIQFAFKGRWEANPNALSDYGFPVTNEVNEGGRPVQYFERAVFEYHDGAPPQFQIQLRRLGASAAAAAGHSGLGIP